MNFDDLDKEMRQYEKSLDQVILPEIYLAARIDGRNFTRLTKEICQFEAPFDVKFRDMMVQTTKSLMECGFRVVYGYTQSDEISLLFHMDEETFGRKVRKYNSILAGTASAAFSLQLGQQAVFDCRMIPLPNIQRVKDYFQWRQEDANRNALNAHCYWMLRKNGMGVREATAMVSGKSIAEKNELLFQNGINYNNLPAWQKRGVGLYWKKFEKQGVNPLTGKPAISERRGIFLDYELPIGEEYGNTIANILLQSEK